jgi:putative ABC transport system ATP-binding protein
MTSKRTSIVVEDLHKAYQRGGVSTPVLCGIDLEISSGECVYLAGPSGSGKSTLLSIMGCILTPDSGTVSMLGRDLGSLSDRERVLLRRDQIGFVFQRFQLIRGLNALENVCVPYMLSGRDMRAARLRAAELLEAVGLASKAKNHPRNMSTGQCQRVALARALMSDPPVILADEPTASLDAENGLEIMRLLRRLTAEQGRTAVVVTHDPRIFHLADRILHLEEGRIQQTTHSGTAPQLAAGGVS